MQYKQIDCKMKEVYYTPLPLKENEDTVKSRFDFWNSMNNIAIQNMTIQHIKIA